MDTLNTTLNIILFVGGISCIAFGVYLYKVTSEINRAKEFYKDTFERLEREYSNND